MDDNNNNLTPEEVAQRTAERDAQLEEYERLEAKYAEDGITSGDAPETDEDRAELDEIRKNTLFVYNDLTPERLDLLRRAREAYNAGTFDEFAKQHIDALAEGYRTADVSDKDRTQLVFFAGAERLKSKKGRDIAAADAYLRHASTALFVFVMDEITDPAQQEELRKMLSAACARAARKIYNPPKVNPPKAGEFGYMTDPFNKALAQEKGEIIKNNGENGKIQQYRSININFSSPELRNKGEIATGIAIISYGNGEDVPAEIDLVDNAIISITSELFLSTSISGQPVNTTLRQIWRTAHGFNPQDRNKRPTYNQAREYLDRLIKLNSTNITLRASKNSTSTFFLDPTGEKKTAEALYYTPLDIRIIQTRGADPNDDDELDAIITILAPSMHYERSQLSGGRMLVPLKYLQTPPGMRESKNSENIKLYLLREIMFMKNKTYSRGRLIALDTLYAGCRIELSKDAAARREETRTTRDIVEKLLAGWEKTGFIKGWETYTNKSSARRIAGYKITL